MMTKTSYKLLTVPTITIVGLLFFGGSISALASPSCEKMKGCDKKICELEKKLVIAGNQDNKPKATRLTKALEKVKEHCTNDGLKDELIEDIAKAKAEVTEYEADLNKAVKQKKSDKVFKYKAKIKDKKRKIKQLEKKLSILN
ncbi:DUF1090 domain-containing protein [Cognaticolwellia beringensis]|uniref:DUF1090 domain-containing protein n=1 Tax=Cognaticolwellia beringensis TaxID=1967665 RepID=A0A222GB47_9GAMM|nr:DUF1090 domain-containing protein [Cognaticolwellia beringensis]ASP49030.1 DUF1090 domain-containing protein [Cognaticolwellia beringensis]